MHPKGVLLFSLVTSKEMMNRLYIIGKADLQSIKLVIFVVLSLLKSSKLDSYMEKQKSV